MESIKDLRARNGAFLLLGWLATAAMGCDPVERPLVDVNALGPAAAGAGGTSAATQIVQTDPTMQSSAEDPTANVDDLAAGEDGSVDATTREADADAGVGGDGGASCPGCFIGGECFAVDAVLPENHCQICDPNRDRLGWSNNDGIACDDGLFCTVDDVCRAGACEGTARSCEDGVACNGISTCLEESDSCSPPVSQCGNNAVCDTTTDSCQSTCDGCVINGVCVAGGTEAPGNPCQVCDPARSTTAYSIVAGKACGAAETACSGQDTCDAQGRCQPNNLPANTPCGSPNSSACDQPDACDGNGTCQQRLAANGSTCDDGAFCTVGDQCQGGRCVSGGNRNCGANQTCNEGANQCQCQGRRDCTSPLDNDCDGRPDNTVDNVCRCAIDSTQECQTHANLDGIGRCRSGTQTCVAGANNSSSNFGPCTGSQGPLARDCRSAQDNDCDGRPDNTIDSVCECIPGGGNGPCSGDPNNSRCNAQGQCVQCQSDGDCSLVAGGRIDCVDGQCVVPLAPLSCSTASPPLSSTAPSTVAIAGPPPEPQGGEIQDGFYFKTEVRFYDGLTAQPVPSSTIRIQAGTFIQRIGEFTAPIGGRVEESITAGTVNTNGSSANFNTSTCINGVSSGSRTNTVGYDASATRLLIHRAGLVEVFDR